MSKKRKQYNPVRKVEAVADPFHGATLLLAHCAGCIETAFFRVGKQRWRYVGAAGNKHVSWQPLP